VVVDCAGVVVVDGGAEKYLLEFQQQTTVTTATGQGTRLGATKYRTRKNPGSKPEKLISTI
jgi:hypothetical protein